MRIARRWTEQDLQALAQRQYGLASTPAPPLSPEAAQVRLAKIRATRRKLEAVFEQHLTWTGMRPVFDTQVQLIPGKRWKFDYFARDYRLAVEIHGGTHSEGRHVRGEGFHNDRTKINAAQEMGINVLEFTGAMLEDGSAIAQTERMLKARGWTKQSGVIYDTPTTREAGVSSIHPPSDAAAAGGVDGGSAQTNEEEEGA